MYQILEGNRGQESSSSEEELLQQADEITIERSTLLEYSHEEMRASSLISSSYIKLTFERLI